MKICRALNVAVVVLIACQAASCDRVTCASFTVNTRLIHSTTGNAATLTFTVNNTCQGENSHVKSIKAFPGRTSRSHFLTPTCNIRYDNGECLKSVGCSCEKHSPAGQIENFRGDVLTIIGELGNGGRFDTTVDVILSGVPHTDSSPNPRKPEPELEQETPENESSMLIVVVSVSASVVVIVIVLLTMGCIKHKQGERQRRPSTTEDSASQPRAAQRPVRPLPARPVSAKGTGSSQSRRLPRPHSSHSYVEVDVDNPVDNTEGASQTCTGRQATSKGNAPYLHPIKPVSDQSPTHSEQEAARRLHTKCDDNGYLLPNPFFPSEKGSTKPLVINTRRKQNTSRVSYKNPKSSCEKPPERKDGSAHSSDEHSL